MADGQMTGRGQDKGGVGSNRGLTCTNTTRAHGGSGVMTSFSSVWDLAPCIASCFGIPAGSSRLEGVWWARPRPRVVADTGPREREPRHTDRSRIITADGPRLRSGGLRGGEDMTGCLLGRDVEVMGGSAPCQTMASCSFYSDQWSGMRYGIRKGLCLSGKESGRGGRGAQPHEERREEERMQEGDRRRKEAKSR